MNVRSGLYVGDGNNNRVIDPGMGTTALELVIIRRNGTSTLYWMNSIMSTDGGGGLPFIAGATPNASSIKTLNAGGTFTIGTDVAVNNTGDTYYYTAINNADGLNDCTSLKWTGNGGTQDITCPFNPALVWAKLNGNGVGGWRGTVQVTTASTLFNNAAQPANFITALGTLKFTLGANAAGNTNASTYYGMAFKAGTKLASFSYTGDGLDNKSIATGLPTVQFCWIRIMVSGQNPYMRTRAMASGLSGDFNASALATTRIKDFTGGNIILGTGNEVNANTFTYYGMALGEVIAAELIDGRLLAGMGGLAS